MNTAQEPNDIFEQLTKEDGGRLNESNPVWKTPFAPILEITKDVCLPLLNKEHNIPLIAEIDRSIHFQFIMNSSLNACALGWERYNFIAFNFGSPQIIFDLFCKLMCTKMFSPSVRSNPYNGDECPSISECMKFYENIFKYLPDKRFTSSFCKPPSDPNRFHYAVTLGSIATHFLFLHEWFHIARGHLDYMHYVSGVRGISELHLQSCGRASVEVGQVLEFDADTGALVTLAPHYFEIQAKEATARRGFLYEKIGDTLVALYLSIGVIFILFDKYSRKIEDYLHQSHPHPHIRFANAVSQITRIACEDYGMTLEECKPCYKSALSDLEQFSTAIGGHPFPFATLVTQREFAMATQDSLGSRLITMNDELKSAQKELMSRIAKR